MAKFKIAAVEAGGGWLGLCPMPGAGGDYAGDLASVTGWGPALVLSMTMAAELARFGAAGIGADLRERGIGWRHLPVEDYQADSPALAAGWAAASAQARAILEQGGRVLVHCRGGCGRSGMAVLRLMVELGEAPETALPRLRAARPCAVETDAQYDWAASPPSRSARTRSS